MLFISSLIIVICLTKLFICIDLFAKLAISFWISKPTIGDLEYFDKINGITAFPVRVLVIVSLFYVLGYCYIFDTDDQSSKAKKKKKKYRRSNDDIIYLNEYLNGREQRNV